MFEKLVLKEKGNLKADNAKMITSSHLSKTLENCVKTTHRTYNKDPDRLLEIPKEKGPRYKKSEMVKPRTNDAKRRSVLRMLEDKEWSKWSDREIARRCGVSSMFVSDVHRELSVHRLQIEIPIPRIVERNGTTYPMDTSHIGKKSKVQVLDKEEIEDVQETNKLHLQIFRLHNQKWRKKP
jgi:hypothetical protein